MVVLKGIPVILSPELLYALAQMGHGDELVLADANFPSSSICAAGPREIRADGHGIPELLEAILQLLPLDAFVTSPAMVMELVEKHKEEKLPTPVWDKYQLLLDAAEGQKGEGPLRKPHLEERGDFLRSVILNLYTWDHLMTELIPGVVCGKPHLLV